MKVNNRNYPLKSGLTVDGLIAELKQDEDFSFLDYGSLTIILNGQLIEEEEYQNLRLREEDEVDVISAMAGG